MLHYEQLHCLSQLEWNTRLWVLFPWSSGFLPAFCQRFQAEIMLRSNTLKRGRFQMGQRPILPSPLPCMENWGWRQRKPLLIRNVIVAFFCDSIPSSACGSLTWQWSSWPSWIGMLETWLLQHTWHQIIQQLSATTTKVSRRQEEVLITVRVNGTKWKIITNYVHSLE